MVYDNICEGVFIDRPNRFIAEVEIEGKKERCHVKNTGRCRELLIPGAKVYLNRSYKPERSTKYDLIAVYKGRRLINMDSQAPNKVFLEHLKSGKYIEGITLIKPEAKYGSSRFDFYVEAEGRRIFIEVKGVTLEEKGAAMFPDAPTLRGIKHLKELCACIEEGCESHIVFVIQMKDILYFSPNVITHSEFDRALAEAEEAGVKIAAMDCDVSRNSLSIGSSVPVKL